jgi:hypothetical protein
LILLQYVFSLWLTSWAWGQAEPPAESQVGLTENYAVSELEATGSGAGGVVTATLAMTGDPAPDGNGDFNHFGFPTVNGRGAVAVHVLLSNAPSSEDQGIYLFDAQGATKLVRRGDPVPSGNGDIHQFPFIDSIVALNAEDRVAFAAELINIMPNRVDSGVDPGAGTGIFTAHATEGVMEHVRLTDPAPDGNGEFGAPQFIFRPLSPPGLDDQGRVAFHGYLINTTGGMNVDDFGIFRADGSSVTQLLRLGQAAPIGGQTVVFIRPQFGSNATGQVDMEAKVDVHTDAGDRIYVDTEGGLQQVFSGGGAPPDGDGIIINMERTRITENGNIAFQAFVNDTADVLDEGITLFFYDRVVLQQIARIDQLAPFETVLFEFDSFPGLDLNNQNEVVFSAGLQFDSMPVATVTSVIYRWKPGEGFTVAVHEGDPAPDGNGTFGNLEVPVFLNESGQIAFGAEIEGTVPPLGLLLDIGLFVIDPDGTIHTVARTGQMLAGATVVSPQSLASTDFIDGSPSEDGDFPLRLAGIDMINNRGQVAFSAILSDDGIASERGLFLWNGPLIYANGMEDGTLGGWDSSFP